MTGHGRVNLGIVDIFGAMKSQVVRNVIIRNSVFGDSGPKCNPDAKRVDFVE
jgi:hypothetical protein